MKKHLITFIFIVAYLVHGNAQNEIQINTEKSTIQWTGSKLFGFGKHYGTVEFKSGSLIRTQDKITGGNFTIDMSTIINTDGKYNEMLVDHLKNEDFFNVKKNPVARLIFTEVTYLKEAGLLQIKADLTIKHKTNPIEFRANLLANHSVLNTEFKIDRTDWEITYESKGFATVKNQVISDAIAFKVNLQVIK